MKYIILERYSAPVLFDDPLTHEVAACGRPVISAGFVSIGEGGEIKCSGESVSLRIKSHPAADEARIARMVRGYV